VTDKPSDKKPFAFNANLLEKNASEQNDKLINSAINTAIEKKKGPVHINMFEEPFV
jgi:hypothetical protein